MNVEQTSRAFEDTVRTIFDLIPDPSYIWQKNESGELLLKCANSAAIRVSMGKISDFLGCAASEFFADTPGIPTDLNRAIETGDVIFRETPYHFRSTGQKSHLEVHCARLNRTDVIVIARQMDQQHSLSQALQESETRNRILMEGLHDGIVLLDANGAIQVANSGFIRLVPDRFGIGRALLDCIPPDVRSVLGRWMIQLSENVPSGQIDVNWSDAGVRKIFEVNGIFLPNGLLLQFHDVTANHQLDEEISRRQRMEAISSVARQIAHDFNNFLSPMIGIPDVLRMRIKMDSGTEKLINLVQSAAQQMSEINSQLMCLSRIAHPVRKMLNINELIQSTVSMSPLPETIQIQYRFNPELFLIPGDESQLLRILTNVLKNAVESMQGKGQISIFTENVCLDKPSGVNRPVPSGDYVRVSIEDSGVGVSGLVANSIFDPFFSTKQTTQRKGLGLGLSVVAEVMAEHRGFIDFHNTTHGGACFQLYFPIQHNRIESGQGGASFRGGTESILIVDDNPIYLEVLSQMLMDLGYTVETRESGETALILISHTTFDLIILDMMMQPMDGAETYERILKIRSGQRAIVISAYSESERLSHARNLGIRICLTKPIDLSRLASAVRKVLDTTHPG